MKLDDLIEYGNMPVPTRIKIDVDGFEHKVIEGAKKTLNNPSLKSLCSLPRQLDTPMGDISAGFGCCQF